MKTAGAVLVLLGGFATYWEFSRTQRRQLALIRDLAAALTQLAGEIRWKLLPLPEAINQLCGREISGSFFEMIQESMQSGNTLQFAWEQSARRLSTEISDILCRMEWGGDLARQEGSILYAAQQLTELGERKQDTLRQREKLCAAAALSVAGILVLILM